MRKHFNRLIAITLAAVMMTSELSVPVYAVEDTGTVSTENETTDTGLPEKSAESKAETLADDASKDDIQAEPDAVTEPEAEPENANDPVAIEDEDELLDENEELDVPEDFVFVPGYVEAPHENDYENPSYDPNADELLGLETKYISPIAVNKPSRNQNPHGTCWAFATMSAVEASAAKHGVELPGNSVADKSIDLSELHLAYFAGKGIEAYDPLHGLDGDINGRDPAKGFLEGGSADNAAHLLSCWIGAADEASYGYGNASSSYYTDRSNAIDDVLHLKNYYVADPTTDDGIIAVKQLIKDYGTVATSYYALTGGSVTFNDNETVSYSGVYNSTNNCYYFYKEPFELNGVLYAIPSNHAVSIIGWDDNFSKDKFVSTHKPPDNGAWLIRNSWDAGNTVDSNGNLSDQSAKYYSYFWLSYYDNSLQNCYAFEMTPKDYYDHNYQYDGCMTTGWLDFGDYDENLKYANIFKASSDSEVLKSVFFATHGADVHYTVDIYKDVEYGKPVTGTLVSTKTGDCTYAGGHAIDLDNEVSLSKDQLFSVVITVSAKALMEAEWFSDEVYITTTSTSPGRSLMLFNGSWEDASENGFGDWRIKAFTVNGNSTPIQCTVTLNANGGSFAAGANTSPSVTFGKKYGVFDEPTRTGYKFAGWSTSQDGPVNVSANTIVNIADNHDLYAQWTALTCQVTFDPKGGYFGSSTSNTTPKTKLETYDSQYVLPTKPKRTNYTFKGWFTAETGGEEVTESTIVKRTDNHPLFARWEGNERELTLNLSNGQIEGGITKWTVYFGKPYGSIPSPTKTGYRFDGWSTSSGGSSFISPEDIFNSSSVTDLYAHWTANKYWVTFDVNGGSSISGDNPRQVTFGNSYGTLPTTSMTGYTYKWCLNDGTEITKNTKVNTASDHTLKAIWTAKIGIKATFDANGGTCSTTYKTVTYGQEYGDLPTPTKKGFKFEGWYDANGNTVTADTTVINDTNHTLTARWSAKKIKVTLDSVDGTCGTSEIEVYYNDSYGSIPDPIPAAGYKFEYWYFKNGTTQTRITSSTKISIESDHTIYAKYSVRSYTVTFDKNGGDTVSSNSKSVKYKDAYGTLPNATRKGYNQDGWHTDAIGGTKIEAGTTVTTASDHTLYAHWIASSYTVTLDANGGKIGTDTTKTITVTYDKTYGDLDIPEREGYDFAGWFDAKTGGTEVTKDTEVKITANQTLYAHWNAKTYTVTFDPNYEGGTATTKDYLYDSKLGVLPELPPLGDKHLIGWFTAAEGGVRITEQTVVKGTVTYYAHWEKAPTCTVTFDENWEGGKKETKEVVKGYRLGDKLPDGVNVRYGYDFTTWSTAKKGGQAVTADTVVNSNVTFYALWAPKTYTLKFDGNNGVVSPSGDKKITFDAKYGTLPTATRNGYKFAGWYTQIEGGDPVTASTIVKTEGGADGHKLFAHWNPNAYKVAFDVAGGVCSFDTKTVYFDGKYGELPTASRAGYDFDGWFTQASGGSMIDADTDVTDFSDHTLYAQWTLKTYKVAFDSNGGTCETSFKENVPYLSKYGELPQPTWDQHAFIGWFTEKDEDMGIRIKEDSLFTFTDNDHVLYAHWEDWGEVKNEENKMDRDGQTVESIASDNIWVRGVPDWTPYTSKAIRFDDLRVYRSNKLLVKDVDYTLSYKNNTNAYTFAEGDEGFKAAKAPSVIITGKGNYNGKRTVTFRITPLSLEDGKAYAPNISLPFNNKAQKGTTTVYYTFDDGRTITLKKGTDYYLVYSEVDDYKNPGGHKITIKGKGNYIGEFDFEETILDKTDTFHMIGKASIKSIPAQQATGEAVELGEDALVVTSKNGKDTILLTNGKDYEVEYRNNVLPGTATVIIKGLQGGPNGDFFGTKTVTFKINGISISKATISLAGSTAYSTPYTGAPIKLEDKDVSLSYIPKRGAAAETLDAWDANTRPKGHYTVDGYTNNINAGKNKAYVNVSGHGRFTGTAKKAFTIMPVSVADANAGTEQGNIEIKVIGTDRTIDGKTYPFVKYQKGGTKPAVTVVFHNKSYTGAAEDYTLVEGKDYTLSFKNNSAVNETLADAKKIPTVTITGKGNFTGKSERQFGIVGGSLEDVTFTADDVVYKNKVGNFVSKLTVTDTSGKTLSAGTDYDKNVTYVYKSIPTGTKVVDKKGNVIADANAISNAVSNGEPIVADAKIHIAPAGTVLAVKITGIKNYLGSTPGEPAEFRIVKSSISSVSVKIKDQVYTGKRIYIGYDDILQIKSGKYALDPGDYEIENTYVNINKGTGKVVLRGKGNFGSTKTVTFKIVNRSVAQ